MGNAHLSSRTIQRLAAALVDHRVNLIGGKYLERACEGGLGKRSMHRCPIVQGSEEGVFRRVSDRPRYLGVAGRHHVCRERHYTGSNYHEGKSWIGILVDYQAKMSGKPEFRQKVRHGRDAVHGFDAAEFDPSCPRQLAIVPENPQHGFGVVRRMCGSES